MTTPDLTRDEAVDLLVRVADALADGRPAEPAAARHVGQALRTWLQAGGDLEQHLGVRGRRGQRSARTLLKRRSAQIVVRLSARAR